MQVKYGFTSLCFLLVFGLTKICNGQPPAFVSAKATSPTNIEVTFSSGSALASVDLSKFTTNNGVTFSSAAVAGFAVNLTVNSGNLNANFSCDDCLSIAADAVENTASPTPQKNAASPNNDIADGIFPGTLTNAPTASAGPVINISEENAGVAVIVSLAGSNALQNDKIELLLGGASFSPKIEATLLSTDITNGNVAITIPSGRLGSSGTKNITARAIDVTGNIGNASPTLPLTLDILAPTAPSSPPSSSAGLQINADENTGGFSITASLAGSAALANDQVQLLLNGLVFLTETLSASDISAGLRIFPITAGQLGADGSKIITARVIDEAGNAGAESTPLNLVLDTSPPSAPTSAPTAVAGPTISASEEAAGVAVVVTLAGSGALEGDKVELLIGGASFSPKIEAVLNSTNITYGNASITIGAGRLGSDGAKVITARVIDVAGNVGAETPSLNVTLSTAGPSAPTNAPTAVAGPLVNSTEESTGFAVVVTLAGTGAAVGDKVQLLLGTNPFTSDIVSPDLTSTDISNGSVSLTIASGQLGVNGAKTIRARVINALGNLGAISPPLNLTLDTSAPNAPTVTSSSAGLQINASEEGGGFSISVSLASTGAVAGDDIQLLVNGIAFPTDILADLSASDVSSGTKSLTIAAGQLGSDGTKNITAHVIDEAGNIGSPSSPLVLNLDTTAPADFTTGSVIVNAGGNLVPGYYNATNTGGLTVTVPIGNDNSLNGGTVTVEIASTGPFATIQTASITAIDNPLLVVIPDGTLRASSAFANETTLVVRAIITDVAGNVKAGLPSLNNILVDQVRPTVLVGSPSTTIASPASSVSFPISFFGASSTTLVASDVALNTTGGANGSISVSAANPSTGATATVNSISGNGTIGITVQADVVRDAAGNPNLASAPSETFQVDSAYPVVSGISIDSGILKGIGVTNGTAASSLPFTVTFSENVTGVDASDFSLIVGTGISPLPAYFFSITGSGSSRVVTVSGFTGYGTIQLIFNDDGTVIDQVGLPVSNAVSTDGDGTFATGPEYTVVLPSPSNQVIGFSAGVPTIDAVTLNWTNPPSPAVPATHYLIRVRGAACTGTAGTYPAVSDGSTVPNDLDFSDGRGAINVPASATSFTFTTLLSGRTYDFEIVPYTLGSYSSDNIDYLTTAIPTTSATTATAEAGTISAGSTNPPINITSLTTSFDQKNFTFKLKDDDTDACTKTRMNTLVITTGTGNTVTNWADVIAEAELRTTTEVRTITSTNIGASSITFTLSSLNDHEGELDEGEEKEYELRIRLRSTLLNSAGLSIDGRVFVFELKGSNIFYETNEPLSSKIESTASAATNNSENRITVTATQFTFNPGFGGVQPPANALVKTNLSVTPVARATDVFGNTDVHYVNNVNVSAGTLTLSVTSVTPIAGVINLSSIQYLTAGNGNGTLTLSEGSKTGSSSLVNVAYSGASTISASAALSEPLQISATGNASPGVGVFDFTITDDGGSGGDGENLLISQITITRPASDQIGNWLNAIAGATINIGGTVLNGTVSADAISFNLTNSLPSDPGFISDDGSKTYELRIWLKTALGGSLPTTIDNSRFIFEVNESGISLLTNSSNFSAGGTQGTGSGTTTNSVNVVADRLVMTIQPQSDILVLTNFVTPPVAEARDQNGNRDLDYVSPVVVSNAGGIPMDNLLTGNTITPVQGVVTFPSNFQYRNAGNGSLTLTSGSLLQPLIAGVTVSYANDNRINAGVLSEPSTISSVVNANPGVEVFDFTILDDNGTAGDGAPTRFQSLKITQGAADEIGTWSDAIAGAVLKVGAIELSSTNITANEIEFAGIASTLTTDPGYIADNLSKTYTLSIWLKTTLGGTLPTTIDNRKFDFVISEADITLVSTGTPSSSTFAAAGTQSQSSNNTAVAVTATQLDFTSIPTSTSINVNFGPVVVEARDANGNRDLNFTSAVNPDVSGTVNDGFSNSRGLTVINDPMTLGRAFNTPTPGVLTFDANFQFTASPDPANPPVTLTIRAGSLSGTSASIGVVSSTDSRLSYVQANFNARIPYIAFQSNPIPNSTSSYPLATFLLNDGDGSMPDVDGAPTTISSIQFELSTEPVTGTPVSGAPSIQQIALYNAAGLELGEQTLGANSTVTFNINPANYIRANDDATTTFTLRATFKNTASSITDVDNIRVKVVNVTQGPGSEFNQTALASSVTGGVWTKATGAVSNGQLTPNNRNIMDVVATQLVFTQQPPSFAGINEPVPLTGPSAQVKALDAFNLLDAEFDNSAYGTVGNISSAAALTTSSFPFNKGILDLPSATLNYSAVGLGTLTVSAASLPPSASAPSNAVSSRVDVVHVQGLNATGGVITTQSLAGGALDRVLFGVTFTSSYNVSGQPQLSKFTISFSNPFRSTSAGTEILKNFRIFETTGTTYIAGLPQIVANGGSITPLGDNRLEVSFSPPRSMATTPTLSFFLMADVDPTANGSTPPITISVEDGGNGSSTNNNIITSSGSATAAAIGLNNYSFAAIFPPTLASSVPATTQLNVAVDQPNIQLFFSVPVTTLDGKVVLTDQDTGTSIELTAANGTGGALVNPLTFNIPNGHLQPDKVYFVTIAPGSLVDNTGIRDQAGNLFPGISFSGTLYFKTASTQPPRLLTTPEALEPPSVSLITANTALISATFDIPGRAYYVVLPSGATAPANSAAIKNNTVPGTVTSGSFDILQTRSIAQTGLITGLAGGMVYDVWLTAESYSFNSSLPSPSLTPILNLQPYGSGPDFIAGGAGPTFSFNTNSVSPVGVHLNNPSFSICTNSYQILNTPIIISESAMDDFKAPVTDQVQTINMILPAGFQFDNSVNPDGNPKYGKLTLVGTDFNASQPVVSMSFFGSTVLQISYRNDGNASTDNIVISGLRVIANTATSGRILRLGGNALTSSIPDLDATRSLAQLSSGNATGIGFDNSYSISLGKAPTEVVTTIPDNFNLPSRTVELIPVRPSGEYGPSSFSGAGVNVNRLSLAAVTLGIPFNVTITYTDNNGCLSSNSVQYTVYDHNTAIRGLETQYCNVNTNFKVNEVTRPTRNLPEAVHTISYDNLSAYYMLNMTATIPNSVAPNSQIIYGADWEAIVNTLPERILPGINPPNNPLPGSTVPPIPTTLYYNYRFDEAVILDANFLSGGVIPDPYSHFRSSPTAQGNYYYTGGSLGIVEFNADFQSIANAVLQIPLRQNVEFFLPAVPIVEVGQANQSFLDINDPLNPVGAGGPSNKGTPVFCQQGGLIIINGFPAASAGSSTGSFTLRDAETNAPITAGLVDNGNGTATFNPAATTNNYRDIRITYTYKSLDSPCESSASQIIRVSPNPVAAFNQSTLCEDININFTDASTLGTAPGVAINSWAWNFGDPNSGPLNTSSDQNPSHIYAQEGTYPNISLQVTTNTGCQSVTPAVKELKIGSTPNVSFDFVGVDVSQPITFTDNTIIQSAATNSADGFKQLTWTFGNGIPVQTTTYSTFKPGRQLSDADDDFLHTYTNHSKYTVTLNVTSQIGCTSSASRDITVLPRVTVSDVNVYVENFESTDGGWQVLNSPNSSANTTWAHGSPSKNVIRLSADNGTKIWTTNLNGNYNTLERSFLYTPSFDITALQRPMISFDAFVQMESSDGVVLEYSTDNKNINDPTKSWNRLGEVSNGLFSGSQWYNSLGLASKPGVQSSGDLGWSGSNITNWIFPKHALDPVGNAGRARVVFRFALASVKDPVALEGFAIDNVRIGNRTRTILLETFTSTDGQNAERNSVIKQENDYLRGFNVDGIGTTLVNLKYHIGFTGNDPFNKDNPAAPSSRALYYNITEIPAARLDGANSDVSTERYFSQWGQRRYDIQTLQLAQADVVLTATNQSDGGVKIDVEVTPRVNLPASTVLHIAIVEQSIPLTSLNNSQREMVKTSENQFDFVVREMLPSPVGTFPKTPFLKDKKETFDPIIWYPDLSRLFAPANDLAIVAFLQDKDSEGKEVFQVDYLSNVAYPTPVTAVNEPTSFERLKVFPNPAFEKLTVQLSTPAVEDVAFTIVDQMGKTVISDQIVSGTTEKIIQLQDLASGMYFLQVEEKGRIQRFKFMIIH